MDQYKILTVTHKSVLVSELKHYLIAGEEKKERLQRLKQRFGLDELMYLSTCNRVTYFFTAKQTPDPAFITAFCQFVNPFLPEEKLFSLPQAVLTFEGSEAIRHLTELASSLDSMVVGEREIIRQIREAYEESDKMELTGDDIRLAMKFVIPAAKKVLTQTRIAQKSVSVVSLAVQKIKEAKLPKPSRFLLIGAGQTNHLIATYLLKLGYKNFSVFNRTYEHAQTLAERVNGKAFGLDELPYYSEGFDAIVISTSSSKELLTKKIYASLLQDDKNSKLIVDLSIPNNVEEIIVKNYPVHYIEIEHLRAIAAKNLDARKEERSKAEILIHDFIKEFHSVYRERQVEKAHDVIPAEIRKIREKAVQEVFAKELAQLDEESLAVIQKILDYMEKKYIALPISSAKKMMQEMHAKFFGNAGHNH